MNSCEACFLLLSLRLIPAVSVYCYPWGVAKRDPCFRFGLSAFIVHSKSVRLALTAHECHKVLSASILYCKCLNSVFETVFGGFCSATLLRYAVRCVYIMTCQVLCYFSQTNLDFFLNCKESFSAVYHTVLFIVLCF